MNIKKYLLTILTVILTMNLLILLDIPFLRQIFGFLFLTILPGLLILQALKLDKLGFTEKFVLSVGLSISFLMFFGLLLNSLSLSLGYISPLSNIPLLFSFNIAFILLMIVGYNRNKNSVISLPNLNLSTSEKAFLIVPVLFSALSVFGMHIMNITDNNIFLMFLLFLIPAYVVFVCFFNQKFPKRLYPATIFLIGIALLLMHSLRSNHIIIGADTGREFYFWWMTLSNLHWSISTYSTLNACLSISLLPTIYQSVLTISPEFLFKILYSLIFSISPLVIYVLSKKYIGSFYAFLASIFFMSQPTFLSTPGYARTNIAILFCALAIMTLFHNGIDKFNKKLLFIIFIVSTIVSHYSSTYIFLTVLVMTWFGMQILLKIASHKWKFVIPLRNHSNEESESFSLLQKESSIETGNVIPKTTAFEFLHLRKGITITVIALFFAILFFWYSQLTETAFNSGVVFIEDTIVNLNKFFVLESRGTPIMALLGKDIMYKEIPKKIHFASTWMTFILIAIGVISVIVNYYKAIIRAVYSKPKFLKNNFEIEYFAMTLACSIILLTMIALPFVSQGYGIDRTYLLIAVVLSPFFIIGGIKLSQFLQFLFAFISRCFRSSKPYIYIKNRENSASPKHIKIRPFLVILLVLVPYFMCTTGSLYQIYGIPNKVTLNSEGDSYDCGYIHDQESYGSRWLARHAEQEKTIYTTPYGIETLFSQGKISPDQCYGYITSHYERYGKINGYIYLRYLNVVNNEILVYSLLYKRLERHHMEEYSGMLTEKNRIYTNGGSDVFL